MAKIIKARSKLQEGFQVFLSGSVAGNDWRSALIKRLEDEEIIFLDPRSDDYSSLKHAADDPKFHAQIEWELNGLERANVIALYFASTSESPISLLEFGLFGQSGRMIVCCMDGYKHKGYVDRICDRYEIEQVQTLDDLAKDILSRYSKTCKKENL